MRLGGVCGGVIACVPVKMQRSGLAEWAHNKNICMMETLHLQLQNLITDDSTKETLRGADCTFALRFRRCRAKCATDGLLESRLNPESYELLNPPLEVTASDRTRLHAHRIFYDEAAIGDKLWVTASIFTSLLLSFTIVVQCIPEVRDWLWYRRAGRPSA